MTKGSAIASSSLTDPAFEFARLAKDLQLNGSTSGIETFKGLGKFIGIDPSSMDFYEIVGVIGSRSNSLINFIKSVDDEFLDQDLRSTLITGVVNISNIINPMNMNKPFNQVVAACIPESDIRLLRSFSQTARRHRPLRLFSEDERERLSVAINDALQEISDSEDIPPWAILSLEEAIQRLRKILRYFDLFGHDAAFDQLIKIQGEAKASSSMLDKIAELSQHKLVKTAGLISLAASVLLLPPKLPDGIAYYRRHIHEIITEVPLLLGGPAKLLTHQPHQESASESANNGSE